jgi:Domain of unknown function (DUF4412)
MLPAITRIAALAAAVVFTTTFLPSVVVPNFPDLTIKTRQTFANNVTLGMNWYFKGPRQRLEHTTDADPHPSSVILTQCDQKSYFILDEQKKTYLTQPINEMASKETRKALERSDDTVDVTITTDSVDTGERRQVGSYEARRVKTTTTIDANEEAGVQGSKMEIDGWYIDLPGWNCRDDSGRAHGMIMASVGRRLPHYVFRQMGAARLGFAIEETVVSTQDTLTSTDRTELVEMSEAPLDASLFEVPADYQQTTSPPVRIPRR